MHLGSPTLWCSQILCNSKASTSTASHVCLSCQSLWHTCGAQSKWHIFSANLPACCMVANDGRCLYCAVLYGVKSSTPRSRGSRAMFEFFLVLQCKHK